MARYDRVAMLLHWGIGLLLIGQIGFGFALDELAPRGTPARAGVINLHKSLGILLFVLVGLRLGWRLAHRPPAWPAEGPARLGASAGRAAAWGHRLLYATMLALPLAGWLASNFSRHGVRLFGLRLPPWGPDIPAVYEVFNGLHLLLAWGLTLLIAGHVAMALWHWRVRRDGVFERMWPGPARLSPSRPGADHPTGHARPV